MDDLKVYEILTALLQSGKLDLVAFINYMVSNRSLLETELKNLSDDEFQFLNKYIDDNKSKC